MFVFLLFLTIYIQHIDMSNDLFLIKYEDFHLLLDDKK